MYLEFFGLTRHPFLLTPDPGLLFASDGHRRALAYLEYGLHRSEGFVVITGEVGAGKTTVVRTMLGIVDPDKVVAMNMVSSQIDGGDLLRYVAQALQVATRHRRKSSVLARIESQLYELHDRGQRALLVIDEAQNLSRMRSKNSGCCRTSRSDPRRCCRSSSWASPSCGRSWNRGRWTRFASV